MPKLHEFACEECGTWGKYRGTKFCSHSCAMKHQNLINNPAKSQQARDKIAASRKGKPTTLGWVPSQETRTKWSVAKLGTKQSEVVISRRVAGWKKNAEQHGGMTPAHRQQLAQVQKEYSGPKHHNWNGGTSKERMKEYKRPEYETYRQNVMQRDDYTCQECGKRGGRLEVHHRWIPYAQCKGDLAFLKYHPENGQTLCRSCHNKTKTCPRPDLQQPAFSQLPHHIIELIRSQVGANLQES